MRALRYGLLMVCNGCGAEAPGLLETWAEVAAVARVLVAGVGGTWQPWAAAGWGVRTMRGEESGGWCLVCYRAWVMLPEAAAPKAKRARKEAAEDVHERANRLNAAAKARAEAVN